MGAEVSFEHRDLGKAAILRQIRHLDGSVTKVGYPSPSPLHMDAGVSLADLAFIHEYGSPKRGIPSRPFMRLTITATIRARKALMKKLHAQVSSGKLTAKQALSQLGEWYAGQTKRIVAQGSFKPNKPSTIARKGSSRPLIDEGILRNSITHKEEMK